MYFTDHEKEILKAILKNDVDDLLSYLMYFHIKQFRYQNKVLLDASRGNRDVDYTEIDIESISNKNKIFFCEDEKYLYKYIVEFSKIVFKLRERDLILFALDSTITSYDNYLQIIQDRRYVRPRQIETLVAGGKHSEGFQNLHSVRIISTDELRILVYKDNYKTKLELHNEKSLKSAKWSSRIAIITALASIGFGVWSNIGTTKSNNAIVDKLQANNTELLQRIETLEFNPLIDVYPNIEVILESDGTQNEN